MKKLLITTAVGLSAMLLLSGCIVLSLGGGSKNTHEMSKATVGQQLMDLHQAKETGAISEAEYEAQKAKVLREK
jgi:uncharacterized protein YceK